MKKAFTLAEVMITLTVIGIITAIIIPVANNSKPDKNVIKFKKAHELLYSTIQTLVKSEKYYLNGDLGVASYGSTIEGLSIEKIDPTLSQRFCNAFADLVNGSNNCPSIKDTKLVAIAEYGFAIGVGALGVGDQLTNITNPRHNWDTVEITVTEAKVNETRELLDKACKEHTEVGEEIKTPDGVVYYEIAPGYARFGSQCPGKAYEEGGVDYQLRCFGKARWQKRYRYQDKSGMDVAYKTFCIDVDGFDSEKGSKNCDDVKDVCPFG